MKRRCIPDGAKPSGGRPRGFIVGLLLVHFEEHCIGGVVEELVRFTKNSRTPAEVRLAAGIFLMQIKCMAKTITIDEEAYNILRSHKFGKESFSEVIKKEMSIAAFADRMASLERKFAALRNKAKRHAPTRRR